MTPAAENREVCTGTKRFVERSSPLSRSLSQCRLLMIGLLALSACNDGAQPSAPGLTGSALAARNSGGPTVKSTAPDTATVDSTLSVHVFGSGFDAGSRAQWALQGVPSSKVVTNSTQFVSSTELVANISIAADATIASYDVIVTTSSGKGGIGTELFVITAKTTVLPTLGGGARANAINAGGTIVGVSGAATGLASAVKWTLQNGAWSVAQLPGGLSGQALGINATGDIVGMNSSALPRRGVLWPASGGSAVVLSCASDVGSDAAEAINSSGTAVGYRQEGSGTLQTAVVWRPGQCRQDLAGLAAGQSAEPRGIDDAGNASGHAYDAAGTEWAVRWTFNGTSWNAPEKLKDGVWAGAWATNGPGDIAGSVCVGVFPGCPAHAFLWPYPGTLVSTDLGTLGGTTSAAFAINSASDVVGWSFTSHNRATQGFIWSAKTGMHALLPLRTDNHSEAYGISAGRLVIGFSRGSTGAQQAVVWRVP
jgi:uncharacterized membrane protein